MTQIELEELIVRLTADVRSYLEAMKTASESTTHAVNQIKNEVEGLKEVNERLEGFASGITKAFGFIGITVGLREAYESFEKYEHQMVRLDAAIKVNGGNVEHTVAQYKQFAKEMADVSAYSRSEVLSSLQRAEAMGLTGKAAEQASKDALALASATGMDVETATRAVTMYQQGHKHLIQYALGMRTVTDEAQIHERVQKSLEAGNEIMRKEGETATAQISKAWRNMGAIVKSVGEVVAMVIKPFANMIKALSDEFDSLNETQKKWVAGALLSVGVIVTLIEAIGPLTKAYKALAIAKLLAMGPVGWVALGAIGVTVGVYALAKGLSESNEKAKETSASVSKISTNMTTTVAVVAELEEKLKNVREETALVGKSEMEKKLAEFKKMGVKGDMMPKAEATLQKLEDTKQYQSLKEMYRDFLSTKWQLVDLTNEETKALDKLSNAETRVKDTLGTTKKMYETATGAYQAYLSPLKEYQSTLWYLNEALRTNLISQAEYNNAITEARQKLDPTVKAYRDLLIEKKTMIGLSAEESRALTNLSTAKDIDADTNNEKMRLVKLQTDIYKSSITPIDEYMRTVRDLNTVYGESGKNNPQAYALGLAQAEKKLDDTGKAAVKARAAIQAVNGIMGGSAEAQFAYRDYMLTIGHTQQTSRDIAAAQGIKEGLTVQDYRNTVTQGDSQITSAIGLMADKIITELRNKNRYSGRDLDQPKGITPYLETSKVD